MERSGIMSNIRKFSITCRQKNERVKTSVSCQISDRWLKFSEKSTQMDCGEFITLDVMTLEAKKNKKRFVSW